MKLIRYLEMVGQVTGEKLLEKMGDGWDTTELFELIDRGLVSSGFGAHGTRYFRYPAWDGSKVDELLEYITKNPGLDGSKLQKALGWSREKLNRRLEELVTSGEIDKVKRGVSWLYSVGDPPRPVTKEAGVAQTRSPTQPDELGRLILDAMRCQPEWTLSEVQKAVSSPLWYGMENGSSVNLGAKKMIQFVKDGIINREWDGDDQTPALYSLPENRV